MSLKNTAMRFLIGDEAEDRQDNFAGPRLLKSGQLNILVRSPKSFDDVRDYADSLMSGSAVMVSFDAVDATLKNRIFDYLNGVSYIVRASVSKISDDLLLYAPQHVEVCEERISKRSGVRSWLG